MWSAVSKFHKIQSSYVHEICLNILLFAALDVCSFGTILFVVPSRSVSDIKDNVNAKWHAKEHGEVVFEKVGRKTVSQLKTLFRSERE